MRTKTKVKYSNVNKLITSDEDIKIMIIKKPKQRYRTLIKSCYKTRHLKV